MSQEEKPEKNSFRQEWDVAGEHAREERGKGRTGRKNYVLFILCSMMLSTFSLTIFGSYEVMSGIHSEENIEMIGIGGWRGLEEDQRIPEPGGAYMGGIFYHRRSICIAA